MQVQVKVQLLSVLSAVSVLATCPISSYAGGVSERISTVALSVMDRVGSPRGLKLQAVNSNGTTVAEMSNVSSTVFHVPEGSYIMQFNCGKDVVKKQKVTLLHNCAKNEPVGSLCQGETAVVSIACN